MDHLRAGLRLAQGLVSLRLGGPHVVPIRGSAARRKPRQGRYFLKRETRLELATLSLGS